MKSTSTFILVLIAALASLVQHNFNGYKTEFLFGLFVLIMFDFGIGAFLSFKKTTMIRTKYDIFLQLVYLVFGLIFGFLSIKYWSNEGSSNWLSIIFSFLGLANGIIYQNSVQLKKTNLGLIINYRQRDKKIIDNPDSVEFSDQVLKISEVDRIIEIYSIKHSEKNINKITKFFLENYPNINLKFANN